MALGIMFILIGLVYLVKPTLFRRGVWLKTSIAIRTLSEENYIRYMRVLGVLMILAGMVFIIRAI